MPNSGSSSNNNGGRLGFSSLLTLLFIGLKLTGFINWSWFWVLSPMIFVIGFILLLIILLGVYEVIKK